jgi:phosphatidylglycerol:prolipoprotein diacylglycerol transferase
MFPVLFKIGPLTVHTYGFLIALGVLVALGLAAKQAGKTRVSRDKILDFGMYALLSGIIGARVFFVLVDWSYYRVHPSDIVKIWEGGLVFYGGVLFAVPTALWYVRRSGLRLWPTADIWAPSLAIGHAIGRIGCFCAGCCYGRPAEGLPWAVTITAADTLAVKGVPLHPTQLYESAAELVNFLVLITLRKRQSFQGQLFWVYILNYSVIRSVVEIFRGDMVRGFLVPGFSISQGISVLMFASALVMMAILRKKRPASV